MMLCHWSTWRIRNLIGWRIQRKSFAFNERDEKVGVNSPAMVMLFIR
jgi:hypothetical protein